MKEEACFLAGDHLDGKNRKKIGIVILGNSVDDDAYSLFHEPQEMPLIQIESLKKLIYNQRKNFNYRYIRRSCGIYAHQQMCYLNDCIALEIIFSKEIDNYRNIKFVYNDKEFK